jgi:Porin subfamily
MTKKIHSGAVALGSLTATVALLAGLSHAQAQSAPGAGSFPQSFLIPGTNTSISVYGVVKSGWKDNFGAQHMSNAGFPAGGASVPFPFTTMALQGAGAASTGATPGQNALHGGFDGFANASTLTFETRTPSALGEVKTVLAMDMNLLPNQGNYSTSVTTSNINPKNGQGNTDAPRLLWAYATVGPWLIGQYNSAWADPLLFPDVSDSGFDPGYMNTANIRQPQIRYTYLAGSGVSLSASMEMQESGTFYLGTGATMTAAGVSSFASDNTDIGGIVNLPSFNAGVAWDQPWGHLMARVGVNRNEIRNTLSGVSILTPNNVSASGLATGNNNIKKWGWAAETGGYLNTWGQDQWKWLINYSKGVANYSTDLSSNNTGSMFCNGYSGSCKLIDNLAFATNYTHRFNPNWRSTAAFGYSLFSKPSNTAGLTNTATGTGGATAAQLAAFEKNHLASQLNLVWSPLPGITDIYLEWDHYDRWVQASNTSATSNVYSVTINVFW